MYYRWLDRWDERQAGCSDAMKDESRFALGAELAFSTGKKAASIVEFCNLSGLALADLSFFNEPDDSDIDCEWTNGWIKFRSSDPTETRENNYVWAKVTESRAAVQTLVTFHHWNATSRYRYMAQFLAYHGISVVEMALPYHFERSRPGSSHADYMLSPNLGRTLRSMRQAVLDGRRLIRILANIGDRKISVLGMSLGSWVAGLIAASDPLVRKAALLLSAGSLADMVWTGRATQHIRASLDGKIELIDLRRAWGPLDLENYAKQLSRPDLDLLMVSARRDTVVLPELTTHFCEKLRRAGATPGVLNLNCGHYSLSQVPYVLQAGLGVFQLMRHNR